jgi:molybdopterin-dependent oxidoreductase alpha subunit
METPAKMDPHTTGTPDSAKDAAAAKSPQHHTTAQRPTRIGTGIPETSPAVDAHLADVAGAEPVEETEGARIGHIHHVAAGIPAVYQSLRFTLREMGLVRGLKTWLEVNKKTGFDCQSCAWPSPDEGRHIFEFCESGVKAVADEATRHAVAGDFFAKHSITDLQARSDLWLGQQGRLTRPMIKQPGATHYEEITWDAAFKLMADTLHALPSPDAAAFYTSGRTNNEAAFLYQLFVRQFGTNNLPDCSNMCHEASGSALNESIGIGKGCVTLEDFKKTECIFIVGQNPGTNHPRMMTSLEHAKKNGATIISANPLPETGLMKVVNPNPQEYPNPLVFPFKMLLNKGTPLTDIWLPVRINGDLAMFKGIMKEMLAAEDQRPGSTFDLDFIREYTVEVEAMIADLRAADWDEITKDSGLTRQQIHAAAAAIMRSKSMIICWAMGLTQHRNAVATIQYAMNLLLLRGDIGKPGAGPCPVRGHSNVQGDRTMGIWERMNAAFMAKLGQEFSFDPPKPHGTDAVETVKGMHRGDIQFFLGLGGNFVLAMSDTNYTAAALQKCRLTAHVSIKLNRSHLITGDTALILPALGRSEKDYQQSGLQFVTVEDSMGIINPSRGCLEPHSKELKSEVAIVCGLARATLGRNTSVDWEAMAGNYDLIRDRIERVIPGFEDFNQRIRQDIFYLPNAPRDHRKFNNDIGKAKFITAPLPAHKLEPGQYVMMSIRSHDQFNTHIYGLDDRYRGIYNGRRVIFMHADDIREAGLKTGQLVDLTGHHEGETRRARHFMVTPYEIPRGCTATYYPETNVLVPINSTAERANTPSSKYVVISIAPSPDPDVAVKRIIKDAREAKARAPAESLAE